MQKPFAFLWKIPLNEGESSMDVANFINTKRNKLVICNGIYFKISNV
jgi:hypothetical protein